MPGERSAAEDVAVAAQDQLALIFLCCHPALNDAVRVP